MNQHIALVLAAGFSTRYGSDKRFSGNGRPLVCRTLEMICSAYQDVFIVHRYHDPELLKVIANFKADCIPADKYNIGLGESMAQGVKHILTKVDLANIHSVTIFLADMPFITPQSIISVKEAATIDTIVRPSYQQIFGHPVCFGQNFISQLLTLSGDTGGASVIKNNKQNLVNVSVNDPGVINDIDSPGDWLK